MKIHLPRNLFPQIYEDISVNPASRRKVVLPRITRKILEQSGYKFGEKIRVPGGYAYEAVDPEGKKTRLGLKTAVNRWLNTAPTLVERVDVVVIATFGWDEDDEKPIAFELIAIESHKLLAMIAKVKQEAEKMGMDRNGHYYMPLDQESFEAERGHLGCVAGSVIAAGKVLLGPQPIVWVKDDWGDVEMEGEDGHDLSVSPPSKPSSDVATIVAKAKLDLAQQLNISADKIDLSIRF